MNDPTPAIDPRTLGRLLLIQTALHAVATVKAIAEFVCRGLEDLPGTPSVTVRIRDIRTSSAVQCGEAEAAGPAPVDELSAVPADHGNLTFAIRTLHHTYGAISLEAPDLSALEPYRPFLESLTNTIALTIENRENEISLRRLNEGLESVVRDRTRELVTANAALSQKIGELKQSEKALRESEARLNKAQEISHVGSWECDLSTGRLTWSDEVYRIFGLTPQVFGASYQAFLDAVHPDDRSAVDAAYAGSLRSGLDTYEFEHRVVRRSTGEIRHIHEKCEYIRDTAGKVIRSVGMALDITERKLAEEAVRRSEERYRLIFASSPLPMWVYDQSTLQFLAVNESAVKSYGYTEQEFLSMTIRDIRPPEDVQALESLVKVIPGGLVHTGEWRHRKKDGSIIRVSIHSHDIDLGGSHARLVLADDITERKRTEEAFRQLSRKNEEALRVAQMGHWEFDIQSGLFTFNDQYYTLHGTTAEGAGGYQMTADTFARTYVHPDDAHLVQEAIHQAVRASDPGFQHQIEARVLRADGEVRTVSVWFRIEKDIQGSTVKLHGVNQDITERRRAEDAVRERDRYIGTVLENAPIGFAVNTIHDGKGVFVGGRFEDIYGVPRGSLHSVDDYFEKVYRDPAFREEIRARIMADMATGDAARMRWEDIPIVTASGEKRFVTAINIPLLDQGLMVSTVQDVTSRRQAEVALRESEERFRTFIEQAGDGFELLDEEGRYVDVNSATCRQLEYSRDELLRLSVQDVDPLISRERYAATFRSLIGRSAMTFETAHRRKDGTQFPVEITTSVVRLGDALRAVTLVRDITERKRAEDEKKKLQEQLLQAQKLESIGQLAGGIAHDFNNILAAVVGYSSIVQMKMRSDDPLQAEIHEVLAAADRAAGLTRSLLAFSRKQITTPGNIDLSGAVKKVEKFLSRIIGEDVSLTISVCSAPLTIFADANQIEQVLMNLAANARDAMPGGGSLMISTEQVDGAGIPPADTAVASGAYAMLSVSDTGSGMDEETRAKIFEPFFTTKAVGKGTGLGLAIVYGVVKQNGGQISVYSEVGKGTTFRIYFPLVAGAEVGQKAAVPPAIRRGTETILLAEDDAAIRSLTRRVLTTFGYNVVEAEDGDAALKKFHEHVDAVRLIITDVIMPKKSGRDLFEEARKKRPGIKVIFTSGYPSDFIEREGVIGKAVHFLAKPASPQMLLQKVREALDRPEQ